MQTNRRSRDRERRRAAAAALQDHINKKRLLNTAKNSKYLSENRSQAIEREESNDLAGGIEAAHKLIMRWDSTASEEARERMIFDGDHREVDRYLRAVDEIRRSVSADSDPSGAIQIAMARLEDEFRYILMTHSSPVGADAISDHLNSLSISSSSRSGEFVVYEEDNSYQDEEDPRRFQELEIGRRSSCSRRSSTTSIGEVDLVPSDAICDLRSITGRMIAARYLLECIQVTEIGDLHKLHFTPVNPSHPIPSHPP